MFKMQEEMQIGRGLMRYMRVKLDSMKENSGITSKPLLLILFLETICHKLQTKFKQEKARMKSFKVCNIRPV